MVKKQKGNFPFTSIVIVIIILAFISMLLIILASRQKKIPNTVKETVAYGQTVYVTPTIVPVEDEKKMIFYHPQNHFTFEYPKEWYIELSKLNVDNPLYYVFLSEKKENPTFRIHFMNDYRGLPYYEYDRLENKTINNLNTKWRIMYRDDKPFEISIMIENEDNKFYPNLFGLYIYLPEENQEEFIQQVEEIIASLK